MPKIFISYRRTDSRTHAGRLYDRLVQALGAQNVFLDVNNGNIPYGSDFRRVLLKSVAWCDVMLAVIGKHWLTIGDETGNRRLDNPNDFVRIEIEAALQRPECLIIPVIVDSAYMPGEKDLPDSLRELAYKNAANVRDDPDFHPDVDKLIRALKNLDSGNATLDPSQLPQSVSIPNVGFNIYEAIARYHAAFDAKEWDKAQAILTEMRASKAKLPRVFNIDAFEKDLQTQIELADRDQQYKVIGLLTKAPKPNIERIREALYALWESYPRYDPDRLERFILPEPPSMPKGLNALGYVARGKEYHQKGEYEHAILDFTEAIRRSPQLAEAYNYRGLSYHHGKQDYDLAIADFNEAIRLNPQLAEAYNNRAASYNKKKEYDQAIADCTESLRLNPQYTNAYGNRGNSYRAKQDYDRAIADYTEAIRINPQEAIAYNNRGNTYYSKKEYDRAIADYEAALRIDPHHPFARKNLKTAQAALKR